mgnify:FL=1|jgi:hypothetical protein
MIGKVKSCIGGTALANYVMKDAKGYELLRNNLSGETPTEILHEMKIIQDLNQKAQYKTLSLVLSPEKTEGQKLTNKELQEMTLDFLKELKIDTKNQQYLAFVHTEKEHKHIHIICNRVKDDGTLVSDNFIGKKAQWAAHRIAKERGLISAKERMIENLKNIEQGKDNKRAIKNKILEKHNLVMKINPKSMEEYKHKMYDFGIKVIPTINRQGLIQGHRFLDLESGSDFKASEIHRKLGLNVLLEKEILPVRTEIINSTEPTFDTDENSNESEFKNQDFSKEDKNLKESIDSIGEVISNSFEEDFDEQQYNKKRRMRR